MTVSYASEVATCRGFGQGFLRLLIRWKGSVYKIVWQDLILYLFIYYSFNLSYNYVMTDKSRIYFEHVVKYCEKYGSLVPISFVLGFFVDVVMERWWDHFSRIPFPDNLATLIGAAVRRQDDKARAVKRTLVRYICASFTITLSMISPRVKKRFPTLDHLVDAGFITTEERIIMENFEKDYPYHSNYRIPLAWASNIVMTAARQGLVRGDECIEKILDELNEFRNKCGELLDYDWISVPLVYTQVVTIAVYSYFLISVIGNQPIERQEKNIISLYFPLIPVLEFFFYMGWLKVAETLINPFGDDDDDFDVMWMVDRHLQVVYLLVDKIPQNIPKITKDKYWEDVVPVSLPFTKASEVYKNQYPKPSTASVVLSTKDKELLQEEMEPNSNEALPLTGGKRVTKRQNSCLQSIKSEESSNIELVDEEECSNSKIDENQSHCDAFENLITKRREEWMKKLHHALEHWKKLHKT